MCKTHSAYILIFRGILEITEVILQEVGGNKIHKLILLIYYLVFIFYF